MFACYCVDSHVARWLFSPTGIWWQRTSRFRWGLWKSTMRGDNTYKMLDSPPKFPQNHLFADKSLYSLYHQLKVTVMIISADHLFRPRAAKMREQKKRWLTHCQRWEISQLRRFFLAQSCIFPRSASTWAAPLFKDSKIFKHVINVQVHNRLQPTIGAHLCRRLLVHWTASHIFSMNKIGRYMFIYIFRIWSIQDPMGYTIHIPFKQSCTIQLFLWNSYISHSVIMLMHVNHMHP